MNGKLSIFMLCWLEVVSMEPKDIEKVDIRTILALAKE